MAVEPAAAGPRWLPVGPPGGEVTTAAFAPSAPEIVFAGSAAAGVFRSADGGETWAPAGAGIPQPAITALAVAPGDPDTVYAGAFSDQVSNLRAGIFLTRDGGASWMSTTPAPDVLAYGFAVDPHDPELVYVATSSGLLRTRFGEPRWSRVWRPVISVVSVAVDPLRSSTLYAGVLDTSGTGGVYKSADSGRSWTRSGGAVPDAFSKAGGAFGLVFDPTTKDTLYAISGITFGEIFRTRDGGRSWWHVVHPAVGEVAALAIGPSGTLYATLTGNGPSILSSADHGSTWAPPAGGGPMDFISWQAVSPGATAGAPETLIAAGQLGIWRSADGARPWRPASHGLIAHRVSALLATPDALLLDVDSSRGGAGLFHSQDHGLHWQRTPDRGIEPSGLLAVDPQQPLTLYGGVFPLVKSTDGGLTWTPLSSYPADDAMVAVVVDPTRSDTVYVDAVPQSVAGQHCEIGKSADGGHTWTCFPAPGDGFLSLAIDPLQPDTLYGAGSLGVWRSIDGGATWATASQGLPANCCTGLALDSSLRTVPRAIARTRPSEPAKLYAAAAAGLFASVDGAASWHLLSAALPGGATRLVVDPRAPDHLYAGIPGAGVLRSEDGGSTWSRLRPGLPASLFSGVFALDPVLPATLYAGTDGRGVFRIDLDR